MQSFMQSNSLKIPLHHHLLLLMFLRPTKVCKVRKLLIKKRVMNIRNLSYPMVRCTSNQLLLSLRFTREWILINLFMFENCGWEIELNNSRQMMSSTVHKKSWRAWHSLPLTLCHLNWFRRAEGFRSKTLHFPINNFSLSFN